MKWYEGGQKPVLPDGAVPHWELFKKYDIVDFETGAKLPEVVSLVQRARCKTAKSIDAIFS
jgi:seryl-tRNA synthetase